MADLLNPLDGWRGAFDLVVESLTVQSLPRSVRSVATANVRSFMAPGGTLVVIAGALDGGDLASGPPWPLTRDEIEAFASDGVTAVRIQVLPAAQDVTARRWLAEFTR